MKFNRLERNLVFGSVYFTVLACRPHKTATEPQPFSQVASSSRPAPNSLPTKDAHSNADGLTSSQAEVLQYPSKGGSPPELAFVSTRSLLDKDTHRDTLPLTSAQIEETAAQLVTSKAGFISWPTYLLKGHELHYRLGGALYKALGAGPDDPFAIAVCLAAQRHALRAMLEKEEAPEDIWMASLDELAVQQELLTNAASFPLSEEDRARVDNQVASILDSLSKKIDTYAHSKGMTPEREEQPLYELTIAPSSSDRLTPKGLGVEVKLETEPVGGKIRLIKDLVYAREIHRGVSHDNASWTTITTREAKLMGRYRFWVTWPDGASVEGTVDIYQSRPQTFLRVK